MAVNIRTEKGRKVDVAVQDQFSDMVRVFLGETLDTFTVLEDTEKDDETIKIETNGVTPVVENFICLQEDTKISQEEIISVVDDGDNKFTLGLNMPLDYAYTTEAGCALQNCDLNVNGSVTPVNFQIQPKVDSCWDVTRIIIGMVLTTAGDDGKFGNLDSLENGIFFRKEDSENSQNLFNVKENADFGLEGYDVVYPPRSGRGGDFGMRSRISFNGQDKTGVVLRLDGSTNDSFRATVRDDLLLLGKFRIRVQGHVVEE